MASLEDMFNGDFEKDKKRQIVDKQPQIKVFHVPPVPAAPDADTDSTFTPESITSSAASVDVTPTSMLDLTKMSKEELLIIMAYDRNFASTSPKPKSQQEMFTRKVNIQPQPIRPVDNPVAKCKGPLLSWRSIGGWLLAAFFATLFILSLVWR